MLKKEIYAIGDAFTKMAGECLPPGTALGGLGGEAHFMDPEDVRRSPIKALPEGHSRMELAGKLFLLPLICHPQETSLET